MFPKSATWALCLALLIVLGGCGFSRHMGNENLSPDKVAKLVRGQTGKQEALILLGPPQTTQVWSTMGYPPQQAITGPFASAKEMWAYWSNQIEGEAVVLPFVAQTSTKYSSYMVILYFDANGVLSDYQATMTNSQ